MSGICAISRKNAPSHLSTALSSIVARLTFGVEDTISQNRDEAAGVAVAARFGTQQIYQNDRLMIACDADLYNQDDLLKLVELTEAPSEGSQTAGLCAALYERFGCDFVEKLQGAFSLVLWDRRKHQLLAAIDGFGINRLVYHRDGQGVVVASRITPLSGAGDLDLEINPRSVANILNFTSNLAPETIFKNVQRLSPGTMLIASDDDVCTRNFWDMSYGKGSESNEDRLARELESVVEKSVAVHCKRDTFSSPGRIPERWHR